MEAWRRERPAADAALADLIAKDRDFLAYQIAEVYAWRGERDKALKWLQISLDNHDTGMLSLLIDPLLRGLHHDPRFNALVGKIGLQNHFAGNAAPPSRRRQSAPTTLVQSNRIAYRLT